MPSVPPLEQFRVTARALARHISHFGDDVADLEQEGLLALHRAFKRTPHPDKLHAFARTVMQRAMQRANQTRSEQVRKHSHPWPGEVLQPFVLPDLEWPRVAARDEEPDFWEGAYLDALERRCGAPARRVAENLLAPRDPRYCVMLLAVPGRGHRRRRIAPTTLRRALGLSQDAWSEVLVAVQAFTRIWLSSRGY